MVEEQKKGRQLIRFEALSDDLTVEAYDDSSLEIRDMNNGPIVIKREDLKPLINHLFNKQEMVGGLLVDTNRDGSIDIYRRTGPTVHINVVDKARFAAMIRAWFGEVR